MNPLEGLTRLEKAEAYDKAAEYQERLGNPAKAVLYRRCAHSQRIMHEREIAEEQGG